MRLFSKRDPEAIVKKGTMYCCPFCGANLNPIIEEMAKPVYETFSRMGSIAGNVTMKTCKDQFIYSQGIDCKCGKHIKPIKK